MPSVKDTHFHARLDKNSGTKKEWDELLKYAERKGVKSVLRSFDDDYQDVYKLLQRKLKEQPINVKKSTKEDYDTYIVLGCIHRPFHNKKLWDKIIRLIKDLNKTLTGVVINGDYLDLESLGQYGTGQVGSGVTLMDEYEDGLDGLLQIEWALGKRKNEVKKFFLFGNHEARFWRHIKKIDSSKYGDALLNPIAGLKLDELGYEVQTDYQNGYITLGNSLEVFHGHFFNQHAASKHLKEANGKSVLFAHTHRFQMFSNNQATAYNTGCLIDLKSKSFNYASRHTKAAWKNGFSIVYIDKKNEHIVNPIECKNDSFFFGGKLY